MFKCKSLCYDVALKTLNREVTSIVKVYNLIEERRLADSANWLIIKRPSLYFNHQHALLSVWSCCVSVDLSTLS